MGRKMIGGVKKKNHNKRNQLTIPVVLSLLFEKICSLVFVFRFGAGV